MKSVKSYVKNHILLNLISPIIANFFLLRTRDIDKLRIGGIISFLFIGSIYVYIPGNDGHTHLEEVRLHYMDMSFIEFAQSLVSLLTFSDAAFTNVSDPYIHVLSFISGSIFGYPEMLHVLSSGLYGIIYMFGIQRFLALSVGLKRRQVTFFLIFILFLTFRGITGINAIRWWTAFWLLFLCITGFAFTKKKSFVWLGGLVPFIHFSFMAIGLPAIVSYWFRKNMRLLLAVFIASFFLGASYNLIKPYIPQIDVVQKKEKYVLNEEVIELSKSSNSNTSTKKNFYVSFGDGFFVTKVIWAVFFLCFWILFKYRVNWDVVLIVFAAAVATYSFGNLMEFSPSVSGRSKAGGSVLAMASLLLILYDGARRGLPLPRLATPLVKGVFVLSIPMILFQLSYFINIVSVSFLAAPIVSWFVGSSDITLKEFIVSLL